MSERALGPDDHVDVAPWPKRAKTKWRELSSGRGAANFITEVFKKVTAAGATGPLTLPADSGFFNKDVVSACQSAGARFSTSAKIYPALRKAVEAIADDAWRPIPHWLEGSPPWPRRLTAPSPGPRCASS
jgi:hypothetical protein